jgi:hypothetical protein
LPAPNGAGKTTTFAREYLSTDDRQFEFVNADEIAGGLAGFETQAALDFEAARSMLRRVDELVEAGADGMKRGLDFAKAEAALKRAAYKAVHGTREERSGRFDTATGSAVSRDAPNRERVRDTDTGSRDKRRKA